MPKIPLGVHKIKSIPSGLKGKVNTFLIFCLEVTNEQINV